MNAASEAVDRSCVQIKNLECELHSALTDCKTLTVGISSLEASCVHQKDVIASLSHQLAVRDAELVRTVSVR